MDASMPTCECVSVPLCMCGAVSNQIRMQIIVMIIMLQPCVLFCIHLHHTVTYRLRSWHLLENSRTWYCATQRVKVSQKLQQSVVFFFWSYHAVVSVPFEHLQCVWCVMAHFASILALSSLNDLYCVEWDVKPYSTQLNLHSLLRF